MGCKLKRCDQCGHVKRIGKSKRRCKDCRKGLTGPDWNLGKKPIDRHMSNPKA